MNIVSPLFCDVERMEAEHDEEMSDATKKFTQSFRDLFKYDVSEVRHWHDKNKDTEQELLLDKSQEK